MQKKLYIPIRRFSLRYKYFFFFDTKSYRADHVFIRRQIRVWFCQEMKKEGSPYVGIFCRVRKKDAEKFDAAMKELQRNMILCGHPDYEKEVRQIIDGMKKNEGCGMKMTPLAKQSKKTEKRIMRQNAAPGTGSPRSHASCRTGRSMTGTG